MKRSFIVLVALLLALAATVLGAVARLYYLTTSDTEDLKQKLKIEQLQGAVNFLVVGVDQLDRVHRSDTIILVRLNLDKKTVKAMSIPRDSRVQIAGHGTQKINAAYAYGGIDLLKDTVTNLTGQPINYSVVLNYDSFPQLVDAIVGVEIDVEKRMVYTDRAQGLYIDLKPGLQHMDGQSALKYCRFRMDALGDEGRMRRQQRFIKAALQKIQSPAIIVRLPEIAVSAMNFVKSDIPVETALQLALYLKDLKSDQIDLFTMSGVAAYIKNISYWIPDLQKAAQRFNEVQQEPVGTTTAETATLKAKAETEKTDGASEEIAQKKLDLAEVQSNQKLLAQLKSPLGVLNGVGVPGLGKEGTKRLERLGVAVGYTGNAKHYDYRYSVIHYPSGSRPEEADILAELCHIPKNLIIGTSVPQVSLVLGKDYKRIFKIFDELPIKR